MSFDTEFLELMADTVRVSTMSSFDGYGDPTYSTGGTTYAARITEIPKLVRNFMGEEVVASHVVWVASTGLIPATSQVSWTASDGSTQFPNLISIERPADEDGTHHHKLYFGPAGGAGRGG